MSTTETILFVSKKKKNWEGEVAMERYRKGIFSKDKTKGRIVDEGVEGRRGGGNIHHCTLVSHLAVSPA